jgi:hypothetical protein
LDAADAILGSSFSAMSVKCGTGLDGAIAADAIAADMALDRDVFGDFGIPIDAIGAERGVGQGPHNRFRCAVSQFGAGVDDLLE